MTDYMKFEYLMYLMPRTVISMIYTSECGFLTNHPRNCVFTLSFVYAVTVSEKYTSILIHICVLTKRVVRAGGFPSK